MNTYRIERTSTGWAMFRARNTRPTIEAFTKEELITMAAELLAGKNASIRIKNTNGTFQELRLQTWREESPDREGQIQETRR
ncbi:DUF2188 domain-containing protein [Pseudomonas veronii]|uniref:DUF2188 domain-containing protein n=1 Tax=Pseudomonas veronii TaxID=76761 RepID=UPI0018CCC8DC|nr:DUF2188 domain-containing protein [Pseudomonas veronii]